MGGLVRTVHPASSFRWAKLSEVCPDIEAQPIVPTDGSQNGEAEEPMVLQFTDAADGESHVYVFSPGAKQNLIAQLTGGIVLPDR